VRRLHGTSAPARCAAGNSNDRNGIGPPDVAQGILNVVEAAAVYKVEVTFGEGAMTVEGLVAAIWGLEVGS
jgi:hypothetical protein